MLFILTIILLIIGFISFRSYDGDVGIGFYVFSAIFFVIT